MRALPSSAGGPETALCVSGAAGREGPGGVSARGAASATAALATHSCAVTLLPGGFVF